MRIDDGQIDDDHKELIAIANRVLWLERPNRDADELKMVIRELYDYVKYHFGREEVLMKNLDYPDFEAHHEKHEIIIRSMNYYLTESHHMGEILSNFRQLVSKWVTGHIMEDDKKLQRFMDAKVDSFLKKD